MLEKADEDDSFGGGVRSADWCERKTAATKTKKKTKEEKMGERKR